MRLQIPFSAAALRADRSHVRVSATPRAVEPGPVRATPSDASPLLYGEHLFGWALALTMLAIGGMTAVYTVVEVFRLHVVLPFGDEWQMVYDMERVRDGSYALSSLANPYNEHRLLVPRLFFFLDTFAFGASERFDVAVTFLFQGVSAAVLIACGARRAGSPAAAAALAGFVLLALFSLAQADNFTIGFQLQFTGVFALANLALLPFLSALRRFREPQGPGAWWHLAAALMLCALSAGTMANGVLAAPTLLALALLMRAPWRTSLVIATFSAAVAALYLHNLQQMDLGLSPAEALAHPLAYPRFLTALLGGIAGSDLRLPGASDPFLGAESLGALGLAGLLGAAATVWRRPVPASGAVLLGVTGFAAASACATTYGRVGAGIDQAFEQRYVENSALFWGALVLFWAPYALRCARPNLGAAARVALAAAVSALAVPLVRAEIRAPHDLIADAARHHHFRDALLSGFVDPEAARYEIWAPEDLARPVAILRAARLSLFAGPEAQEHGRPVADLGAMAPATACTGSVSAVSAPELGPDGVRVSGTAWDAKRDAPVARVINVGPDGRVSGFGSPDKPAGAGRAWSGYATAPAGATVSAYAVLSNSALCRLGMAEISSP